MSKTRSVLFLSSGPSRHNDNFERLPRAFAETGWHVVEKPHESLAYIDGTVSADDLDVAAFDLVWPIGFGNFHTFLDRAQLLTLIPRNKLVTRMSAWLTLHGKSAFLKYGPASIVAGSAEPMIALMAGHDGGWVLKPNAGSFGRDVHFIENDATGRERLRSIVGKNEGEYFVLQQFIADIANGETRTLIAEGRPIASYLRTPTRDIRANVALAASVSRADISGTEKAMVADIAAQLHAEGVGFASIDTVGSHLIEVNVANPGGLGTLSDLYGHDFAVDVANIFTETRSPFELQAPP
jgi:hypothetical protein